MKDRSLNFAREAFLAPFNLAFLAVALLAAVVLGSLGSVAMNATLLFAAAAELFYLGYMPKNERFQRVIRSRAAAEKAKGPSQKEVFNTLSRQNQQRYGRLRQLEVEIKANYDRLSTASQALTENHMRKVDGLLTSYLNLLALRERYDVSMQASSQSEITTAIAALQLDMADDPPRVAAIKERRLRILENRLDRIKKGRENIEIIEAQLATIEDVTKYVHEQSLTLRNPEEVTYQLDLLLSEVEQTESTIQSIEDVLSGNLLGGIDLNDYADPIRTDDVLDPLPSTPLPPTRTT
ncbi:MAG: hypothetical protein IAE99_03980 [Rhodothermales bacterium]|nr:hypothetical protein [Rhodothermales bacterium]